MIVPTRFAVVLFVFVATLFAQHDSHLLYTVEVKPDDRTAFHYTLDIDRPGRDEVALSVAAWAPGSYRLMNAADGIMDVAATDEKGSKRAVVKDGDLTWRVASRGAERIRVTWRFTKLSTRRDNRSFMAKTAALLDGPRNYLYWRDRKDLPAHVTFKLPEGWTAASGLDPTFDPATFTAKDADWLIDCPVLVGELTERRFSVAGIPHRVVVDLAGRPPEFDLDAFVDCSRRVVVAGYELWGGLPYDHFTFLFVGGGGGGLEHLTSTTIGVTPAALAGDAYAHKSVTAHEHFHAWNVKRLRPATLGPFDYDGPVRTKSLWWAEGVTDYYTEIILSRAGLLTEEQIISSFAGRIGAFVRNDASRTISPERNSWGVWDGPYMQGPISYYDQGAVLGVLMDLEIRGRTGGAKSLDDAMRLLYRRFSGDRGFQSEELIHGILDATGVDLHGFFLDHVSGALEPDWARAFKHAGLKAQLLRLPTSALSLTTEASGEDVIIKELPSAGAAVRFGLKDGDVVKAVDGAATPTTGRLARALRGLKPGVKASFSIVRGGKAATVEGIVESASEPSRLRFSGDAPRLPTPPAGSALEKAGIREGDVLVSVGGSATTDSAAARTALGNLKIGETAKCVVRRGEEEIEIGFKVETYAARAFSLEIDPEAPDEAVKLRRAWLFGPTGKAPAAPVGGSSRPRTGR